VLVLIAQSDLNRARRIVDTECVVKRGANVLAAAKAGAGAMHKPLPK
jgi:hypothetical protein